MSGGAGDLIPPAPPTPPDPPRRTKAIICQFCESDLSQAGDVLKLSERAKALRDFEDDLEDMRREHTNTTKLLDEANQTIQNHVQTIARLEADLKKAKRIF